MYAPIISAFVNNNTSFDLTFFFYMRKNVDSFLFKAIVEHSHKYYSFVRSFLFFLSIYFIRIRIMINCIIYILTFHVLRYVTDSSHLSYFVIFLVSFFLDSINIQFRWQFTKEGTFEE